MPLIKLEFKKSKKVLRQRCGTLIAELGRASKLLVKGAKYKAKKSAADKIDKTTAASVGTTKIKMEVDIEDHSPGLQMFRNQTYGCLITEWHSFLNRIFYELAEHCLKKGPRNLVTNNLDISLNGADFSTKPTLRDSIRDALFEKFCSKSHPYRLDFLKEALQINTSARTVINLTKIIKKHVTVRNCLEHADSQVTRRALRAAKHGNKIPMLNADGTTRDYVEGDTISISDNDVQNLKDTMLTFMNFFEVEL